MFKRTEKSSKSSIRAGLSLAALAVVGCLLLPVSAGAAGPPSAGGTSLVFGAGAVHYVADNVTVPVRCLGESDGFCSGVVTLSHAGRHVTIPFSVRTGGRESLFVPLRLGHNRGPRKVHAVATTAPSLGPGSTTKEFLFAK